MIASTFWLKKKNMVILSESSLISVSEDAKAIVWCKDKAEPDYFYAEFSDFLCSIRKISNYWLVIAINYEWLELGRCKLQDGELIKEQAAEWALRVNSKSKV
ncbi:hypothetical protein [Aliivibrio fischeri]|uniref:hypothetical protein n=1 Tax=Aliivibrio fischeri TaxID=668 RepID=UPI0018C7C737|nr:hypothetical protein [Aliivibrio fischeri]